MLKYFFIFPLFYSFFSYGGDAGELVECVSGGVLVHNEDGTASCKRSEGAEGIQLSQEHIQCIQQCLAPQTIDFEEEDIQEGFVAKRARNLTQKDLKYIEKKFKTSQVNAPYIQYLLGLAYSPMDTLSFTDSFLFLKEKESIIEEGNLDLKLLYPTNIKKARNYFKQSGKMGMSGAQKKLVSLYQHLLKSDVDLGFSVKKLRMNYYVWLHIERELFAFRRNRFLLVNVLQDISLSQMEEGDQENVKNTVLVVLKEIARNKQRNPHQAKFVDKHKYSDEYFIVPKEEEELEQSSLDRPYRAQRSSASQKLEISWFKRLWNKLFSR